MTHRGTTAAGLLVALCIAMIQCEKAGSQNAPAGTVKFKTFICEDKEGIGIEAFRLLAPSDWKQSGGIRWPLNNPILPGVVDFRVSAPQGRDEFQVFPNQSFFWTNNQMLLGTFPIGSKYIGAEVLPPVSAAEALRKIVLPRFRGDVKNLKTLKEEAVPALAEQAKAAAPKDVPCSADAAKIRVEYVRDGAAVEEEIYAVVEGFSFTMPTMTGPITNMNWFVDYIFSFKAEKGKLDEKVKTFLAIVCSFKVNPQWLNKYSQLTEMLIQQQIQQIRHIGEISKIISKTHNEISDGMMKSYEERQRVNDRIAENFSNHIRGVDVYNDPNAGRPVELPSGYNQAWANKSGEYILSDSPSYNPNEGSNVEWTKIERKQ